MNTKYAFKANLNPNEPIKPFVRNFHVAQPPSAVSSPGGTYKRSLWVVFYLYTCIPVFPHPCIPVYLYPCIPVYLLQNEPNFFTTKYALLNQNRRNGGQKLTQKNETNPILTNA